MLEISLSSDLSFERRMEDSAKLFQEGVYSVFEFDEMHNLHLCMSMLQI